MKLTARKLKELIKEELEESYMKDKGKRYLGTPPMPEDEMMRTDPDFVPGNQIPGFKAKEGSEDAAAMSLISSLRSLPMMTVSTSSKEEYDKMIKMAPDLADRIRLK